MSIKIPLDKKTNLPVIDEYTSWSPPVYDVETDKIKWVDSATYTFYAHMKIIYDRRFKKPEVALEHLHTGYIYKIFPLDLVNMLNECVPSHGFISGNWKFVKKNCYVGVKYET